MRARAVRRLGQVSGLLRLRACRVPLVATTLVSCQWRHATPTRKSELLEVVGVPDYQSSALSPLEVNLFEDPTGGLTAGAAEELTPTEIESHVKVNIATYSAARYYVLFTPLVDILGLMSRHDLLPYAAEATVAGAKPHGGKLVIRAEDLLAATAGGLSRRKHREHVVRVEQLSQWFTDGPVLLEDADHMEREMGAERWEKFCECLVAFFETPQQPAAPAPEVVPEEATARVATSDQLPAAAALHVSQIRGECLNDTMPLMRAITAHALPAHLLVPFMRQLAMDLATPSKRRQVIGYLPGLLLGLANGRGPEVFKLPANQQRRAQVVADLFLATGQETGNTDLAYLGIQLIRANDILVSFAKQKQLTNVFAAQQRISTDWRLRSTGHLSALISRWWDYIRSNNRRYTAEQQRLYLATAQDGEVAPEAGEAEEAVALPRPPAADRVAPSGALSKRRVSRTTEAESPPATSNRRARRQVTASVDFNDSDIDSEDTTAALAMAVKGAERRGCRARPPRGKPSRWPKSKLATAAKDRGNSVIFEV